MKLSVIHLSDFHIKESDLSITTLVDKIKAALKHQLMASQACVVIVSGDVAFSGKKAEYKIAKSFLTAIDAQIRLTNPNLKLKWLMVPGNHDCDFTLEDDVRTKLIPTLMQDTTADNSVIEALCKVQKEYFAFASDFLKMKFPTEKQLRYSTTLEVEGIKLTFNAYNTAWTSNLNEKYGEIFFPVPSVFPRDTNADFIFSVFHHPANWHTMFTQQEFEKAMQENSDMSFTGHEHRPSNITTSTSGAVLHSLEGGALAGSSTPSSFKALEFDFTSRQLIIHDYVLQNDIYQPIHTETKPLTRNPKIVGDQLFPLAKFYESIETPGAPFHHPDKGRLGQDDIYLPPDFNELDYTTSKRTVTPSEKLLQIIEKEKGIIVLGGSKSGKTALAFYLFKYFTKRKFLPIYIDGKDIQKNSAANIEKFVNEAVVAQYGADKAERFKQSEEHRKLVILDAFESANIRLAQKQEFVQAIKPFCGHLVILSKERITFEELAESDVSKNEFTQMRNFEIKPFGRLLRHKMTRRWLEFSPSFDKKPDELDKTCLEWEKLLNTIFRQNVLPALPVYVLVFLQTMNNHDAHGEAAGTIGYIYEAILNPALGRMEVKFTTVTRFLSELALTFFRARKCSVSLVEMQDIAKKYDEIYEVRLDLGQLLARLVEQNVLIKQGDEYEFQHSWIYYFFVAKYISDNLHSATKGVEAQNIVQGLCKHISDEDSAQILIFLCYFSKDPLIIQSILDRAKQIMIEVAPSTLDDDVEFINKLCEPFTIAIERGNVEVHREKRLAQADHIDDSNPKSERKINEKGTMALSKVTEAMYMVEILGQILRNFGGAMEGTQKTPVLAEAYSVGLRILSHFLNVFAFRCDRVLTNLTQELELRKEQQEHKTEKAELTGRKPKEAPSEDTIKSAKKVFFNLSVFLGHMLIKFISYSVGSDELGRSYKSVLENNDNTATRLIDQSIKFDSFYQISEKEIKELVERIGDKSYPLTLLRTLVADYLYMNEVPQGVSDRICNVLGISLVEDRYKPPKEKDNKTLDYKE